MPKISVIMSVYEEPLEWLHQSINSILQQTFTDFEYIIISDNPSYIEGNMLLKDYAKKDSRIVLIFNEENIGLTKSLNKGLEIAKGEYIARMDADDISQPSRLEKEYTYLEKRKDVDVCGMGIKFIGDVHWYSIKRRFYPTNHKGICDYMLFDNPFAHPVVMYRKEIKGHNVKYNEDISKAQDYYLWHDLLKRGAVFNNLNSIGLYYRMSSGQISNLSSSLQNSVADEIRKDLLGVLHYSETEIELHNEICHVAKTDKSLFLKLKWIMELRNKLNSMTPIHAYVDKLIFRIWVGNCLVYNNVLHVLSYPSKFVCLKESSIIIRCLAVKVMLKR